MIAFCWTSFATLVVYAQLPRTETSKTSSSLLATQFFQHRFQQLVALDMKRSKAKARDDIMALIHVMYTGDDALPLQQDTQL